MAAEILGFCENKIKFEVQFDRFFPLSLGLFFIPFLVGNWFEEYYSWFLVCVDYVERRVISENDSLCSWVMTRSQNGAQKKKKNEEIYVMKSDSVVRVQSTTRERRRFRLTNCLFLFVIKKEEQKKNALKPDRSRKESKIIDAAKTESKNEQTNERTN